MKTLYLGSDDALAMRLVQFIRERGIEPGTGGIIEVRHDHDCPKLCGGPRCACNPDFKVVEVAA